MTGKIIGRVMVSPDAREIDIIIAAATLQNIVGPDCVVTVDGLDQWLEKLGRAGDARRLSSISIIQQRKEKSDE